MRLVGGSEDIATDVRVIAATNADLRARVRAGTFRADLYSRLAVFPLHVPSLRERGDDVELLARVFLRRFAGPDRLAAGPDLSGACTRKLRQHSWPGNVRELRNAIERAVVLVEGSTIEPEDLQLDDTTVSGSPRMLLPAEGIDLGELERDLVMQAIARTRGNVTTAGRLLGMTRDQVRYRLAKYRRAPTRAEGPAEVAQISLLGDRGLADQHPELDGIPAEIGAGG
jgi:DNA-binding NtrC family response regulator